MPSTRRPVDLDGLGIQDLRDNACVIVEARQPERCKQAECDRAAVRKRVAGGRLEGVREGVPEVQLGPRPSVERIAQADSRLERSAATHLLRGLELPEGSPASNPVFTTSASPVLMLWREGLEQPRIDDGAGGPVERADEVLATLEVDAGLSTDRGVRLADERRGHGDPGDPAEVARRNEAYEVAGRAASSAAIVAARSSLSVDQSASACATVFDLSPAGTTCDAVRRLPSAVRARFP